MSSEYYKIKAWYDMGLWNEDRLSYAVLHGVITADEYTEICGGDYIPPEE